MSLATRRAPDDVHEGRHTLSLKTWRLRNCSLAGEQHPLSNSGLSEQFENRLIAERNRWDIARRQLPTDAAGWLNGGGLAAGRTLDKHDANRLWAAYCAALAREGC